jgi:hypothetical protein
MPSLPVASMACRLITSSTPAGSLSLRVQHLAVDVRIRGRSTDVVLLYQEHRLQVKEGRGSFPCTYSSSNFDARPPRQIWTFSLSSMFTSIDAKESQISLIFRV